MVIAQTCAFPDDPVANLASVKVFYAGLGVNNQTLMQTVMDTNVSWVIPGSTAVPYIGTWNGYQGISNFLSLLYANVALKVFDPTKNIFVSSNNTVVSFVYEQDEALSTGNNYINDFCVRFTMCNAKIIKMQNYMPTFDIAQAFCTTNKLVCNSADSLTAVIILLVIVIVNLLLL